LPRPGALLDVLYDPWPAPLAAVVASTGGEVADGLEMIAHQADMQLRSMLAIPAAPVPRRLAAARAALGREASADGASPRPEQRVPVGRQSRATQVSEWTDALVPTGAAWVKVPVSHGLRGAPGTSTRDHSWSLRAVRMSRARRASPRPPGTGSRGAR